MNGMRHTAFICCLVCLLSVCSCIRLGEDNGEWHGNREGVVKLSIRGEGHGSVEALSFDSATGLLVSRAEGEDAVSLPVPKNRNLDFAIGVNVNGALEGLQEFGGINDRKVYLVDCTPEALPAAGVCRTGIMNDTTVLVEAERLVSKVSVGSVDFSFPPEYRNQTEAVLSRIYLINVNGSTRLSGLPSDDGVWHNAIVPEENLPDNLSNLLVKSLDIKIAGGGTVPVDADFYCCPNPVQDDVNSLENPLWSPRRTRLVLEIAIAGEVNCYPVTLPPMECNTEYRIETIRITGKGSSGPDVPVGEKTFINAGISVVPWSEGEEKCALFPITFSRTPASRLSETVFPDKIYVTALTGEAGSYAKFSSINNSPYDCEAGKWRNTGYYWPVPAVPARFIAVNAQLRLQVSSSGITSSVSTASGDIVCARSPSVTGPDPVPLAFDHIFAYLAALKFETKPGETAEVLSVKCRYAGKRTFDLTAGIFTGTPVYSESVFEQRKQVGRDGHMLSTDLLVVPGIVELSVDYNVSHGTTVVGYSRTATVNLQAGVKTTVKLLLAEDFSVVGGGIDVKPWNPCGDVIDVKI